MRKQRILVLGASGMLGNAVLNCFAACGEFDVTGTVRNPAVLSFFDDSVRPSIWTNVDVIEENALVSLLASTAPDIVVNCIGLIKQLSSAIDPLAALPINSLFPHRLARLCSLGKARLVHISTDCVFTGSTGRYLESDVGDATDLYGRSKLLGEVTKYSNAITLRTSIIGREISSAHSLLDWFLAQNGSIKGFRKAIFSGLPTWELATIIKDFVVPQPDLNGLYHVSSDAISKFDLLTLIANQYGKDIEIVPDDDLVIDRSLDSSRFTADSGYKSPVWPELIRRMHEQDKTWSKLNV